MADGDNELKVWVRYLVYTFFYVSMILTTISIFLTGKDKVNLQVSSYSFIAGGIVCFLIENFMNGFTPSIAQILFLLPFIVMLGLIVASIYIIVVYKNLLMSNHYDKQYDTMNNVFLFLTVVETFLIKNTMNNNDNNGSNIQKKEPSCVEIGLMFILFVLSTIAVNSQYISLKYYSADG
jgi:hypothetical protein